MTGIYVHVPFCAKKCPYCDFYSVKYSSTLAEEYTKAVCRNIESFEGRNICADTIYFGGGTPSLLTAGQIERILLSSDRSFELHSPEITLEANPCTVNLQKLSDYKKAGINRLSYGVQSANDNELRLLGRLHSFSRAQQAVYEAVKAGFNNISCDIMLGTQGQTAQSLSHSVTMLAELPIEHISAYMLKIEEGTAFDNDEIRKSVADDDTLADMYLNTVKQLEAAGFMQYEISNFAKNGKLSQHNMKYWQGEEYLGFGPAAHSFFENCRYCCPDDIGSFIKSKLQPVEILEKNTDRLSEYIMLGLRLSRGIDGDKIEQLGNKKIANALLHKARTLQKHGLCKVDNRTVRLSAEGFLVSNDIIGEFLDTTCQN